MDAADLTKARYGVGIDAGGTYTDAVVYDVGADEVLASVKEPTTHHDLGGCIGRALTRVMRDTELSATDVDFVSVSTTLATNAVVENKGARVGLVLIGYDKPVKLPVVGTVYVPGGHQYSGEEKKPLALEELVDGVGRLAQSVDAFAVSAFMSFVNPAHEMVAAKSIELMTGKPVYCSYLVSERAGVGERAATAVLNARLEPVMETFLNGLERAMDDLGLDCPVRVVRGDGKTMDMDEARRRAAATFASGPAATAHFGCRFADVEDAVIVDVGGTTTDVIVMQGRQTPIDQRGSRIGKWETHVDSLQMSTAGVGGDSLVTVEGAAGLRIGPLRVTPLAFAKDAPGAGEWMDMGERGRLVLPGPLAKDGLDPVLDLVLRENGATPRDIGTSLKISAVPLRGRLEALAYAQRVTIVGFTPTDALHVLGDMDLGDAGRSEAGASVLAEKLGMGVAELCRTVLDSAREEILNAVIRHVARMEADEFVAGFLGSNRKKSLLDVAVSLKLPLAGIGAAARYLLPGVAERLGTRMVFPERCEVGNAVGAALLAREGRGD